MVEGNFFKREAKNASNSSSTFNIFVNFLYKYLFLCKEETFDTRPSFFTWFCIVLTCFMTIVFHCIVSCFPLKIESNSLKAWFDWFDISKPDWWDAKTLLTFSLTDWCIVITSSTRPVRVKWSLGSEMKWNKKMSTHGPLSVLSQMLREICC